MAILYHDLFSTDHVIIDTHITDVHQTAGCMSHWAQRTHLTHIHTYIHIHTYTYIPYIRIVCLVVLDDCVCLLFNNRFMYVCICMYVCMCVRTTYIHTYIHTYICTYVHTYVHNPFIKQQTNAIIKYN